MEYPICGYNLFSYVYILSFYDRARRDPRFHEALRALEQSMVEGILIEFGTGPDTVSAVLQTAGLNSFGSLQCRAPDYGDRSLRRVPDAHDAWIQGLVYEEQWAFTPLVGGVRIELRDGGP